MISLVRQMLDHRGRVTRSQLLEWVEQLQAQERQILESLQRLPAGETGNEIFNRIYAILRPPEG